MNKFVLVSIVVIASAISPNLANADNRINQLNPMVQIELNADIRADRTLAEKLITLDIRNELTSKQTLANLQQDFQNSERPESEHIIAIVGNPYIAK